MTGFLNKLRIAVIFHDCPGLNLGAGDLAQAGVRFKTEALPPVINAETGVAEPPRALKATLSISVLKTLPVAEAYKQTLETDRRVGRICYRPDTSALSPFFLLDCMLERIAGETSNGTDAAIEFIITGTSPVNQQGG